MGCHRCPYYVAKGPHFCVLCLIPHHKMVPQIEDPDMYYQLRQAEQADPIEQLPPLTSPQLSPFQRLQKKSKDEFCSKISQVSVTAHHHAFKAWNSS